MKITPPLELIYSPVPLVPLTILNQIRSQADKKQNMGNEKFDLTINNTINNIVYSNNHPILAKVTAIHIDFKNFPLQIMHYT